MSKQYILALDIGTSSVRAGLYDVQGNVLPKSMVKHERTLATTDDGGAEIDADEGLQQVVEAIDDVLAKCASVNGEIAWLAGSSFWHSLVGVDGRGRPTTKVLGWADTRSRGQSAELRQDLSERETHQRTGARFHSSFWPAKLLWIKQTAPKIFQRTDRWLSFSDYLTLHFCGRAETSVSMASATGMFDQRKCVWDKKLLDLLGIAAEKMPIISATDDTALSLDEHFRRRWPRLKETRYFPAIGDGAANNIGAGCLKRSKAALMIGTSGAMRVAFKGDPPDNIPAGLWCYRIDRRRVIIGGALSDGGGLYRWMKDHIRLDADDDKIEAEIAQRKPGAHGLIFMPFVAGERSTGYHESARGAIIGLRSATDSVDIVQAALEAIAFRFGEIFDQLNDVCRVREVIASGGALRESPVWTQIISDVLRRDLVLPETREASSRGAVLHCLELLGQIKRLDVLPTPKGTSFKNSAKRAKEYAGPRLLHAKYYKLLSAHIT